MFRQNSLLFLSQTDFNDEEYITVTSQFRKKGLVSSVVSDAVNLCVGTKGTKVKAEINLYNIHPNNFSALVLIGGNGMRNYWKNEVLLKIILRFAKQKIPIGAICSAPVVLGNAGILKGIDATCYPTDRKELEKSGALYLDHPVVKSGKIVTAQSPQSSLEFTQILLNILES